MACSSIPNPSSRRRASASSPTSSMPNPVLTRAIDRLASREDLSAADAAAVLGEIMAGNASETETAAVLIALRTKGETVDELVGLASTMRRMATPVLADRGDLIDTAGTGGGRPALQLSPPAPLAAPGARRAGAQPRKPPRPRLSRR